MVWIVMMMPSINNYYTNCDNNLVHDSYSSSIALNPKIKRIIISIIDSSKIIVVIKLMKCLVL